MDAIADERGVAASCEAVTGEPAGHWPLRVGFADGDISQGTVVCTTVALRCVVPDRLASLGVSPRPMATKVWIAPPLAIPL